MHEFHRVWVELGKEYPWWPSWDGCWMRGNYYYYYYLLLLFIISYVYSLFIHLLLLLSFSKLYLHIKVVHDPADVKKGTTQGHGDNPMPEQYVLSTNNDCVRV